MEIQSYTLSHNNHKNNYSLVNVKMTREFGWCGITRWQESYSTSPTSPSYLVVWFVLFVINQFHRHIWLFSVLPKGMNTSVQVYWKQCWPLMLFSSLESSGSLWFWKVPTPTVVDTILVILVNIMLPLVITTSSLDIPNLHQQSWQTTLAQRHSCANGHSRHSSKHN